MPTEPGIDPDELAVCLRVLSRVDTLPPEHPDAVTVRRATAGIWKSVRLRRRADLRAARRYTVFHHRLGRDDSARSGRGLLEGATAI